MNASIFKAYDVRGRYPREINESAVRKIVGALGDRFKKRKVVVGYDARLSSPALYRTILSELGALKLKTVAIGFCTTPMFYFWCHRLKLPGIMITASHNPKEFNGLKIVGPTGEMISGLEIAKWII